MNQNLFEKPVAESTLRFGDSVRTAVGQISGILKQHLGHVVIANDYGFFEVAEDEIESAMPKIGGQP